MAGLAGLVLLILGNDPFAAVPSDQAVEGLQIVGTFTAIFAAVVVAVVVARATGGGRRNAPVAGAAA